MAATAWIHRQSAACKRTNVRIGGRQRVSFTDFSSTTSSHAWSSAYPERMLNQRIRYGDTFENPAMPGGMDVQVTQTPVACARTESDAGGYPCGYSRSNSVIAAGSHR